MGEHAVILIVDDDNSIRSLIRLHLESEGFSVLEAGCGQDALDLLHKNRDIDLVILDIMMPDISGIEVCRKIREFSVVPILFLTAKNQQEDKLEAYDIGGDSYLTKPFLKEELLSKVRSLIRRYIVYRGKVTEAQGISLNIEKRTVTKNGEVIDMTDLEMSILSYLFSRKGEIVSIQDIYENVWGERFLAQSSNTVMVHILNIRKKLEDDTSSPKIIRTVWGKGYQIG